MRGGQIAAVLAAGRERGPAGHRVPRHAPSRARTPLHKQALTNPLFVRTELTRAFSGRPARGLVNRFMREHGPYAPGRLPRRSTTSPPPLRKAAAKAGDAAGHGAVGRAGAPAGAGTARRAAGGGAGRRTGRGARSAAPLQAPRGARR